MAEERQSITRKKQEIKEITDFIKGKNVIGIISIEGLPSAQLQEIKKKLRGKADIKIAKSLIIQKAVGNQKNKELEKLTEHLTGPSGVIVADIDPFRLFKIIKDNRSRVFAKPGQEAPQDIIVPEGPTDIPAGPALAELKMAKINVKIDKGKIAIQKDSVVAKEGEEITGQVAGALSKLGIKPMKLGLTINALYEDGTVYTPDVLNIDEDEFMNKLMGAIVRANNLSINAEYPTKQTITQIIQKGVIEAQNLALNAEIVNKFTVEKLLSKANSQAQAVKSLE